MVSTSPEEPGATLSSVNLNLVPTLRALLRERNVSKAAAALHVSQPSVSGALARLREVFQDPLMVRVGRKMELTPLARQLIDPVERACESLTALFPVDGFDPAATRRVFRIGADDYAASLIGPRMIMSFRDHAPGASMAFLDYSLELDVRHRLSEIDVVVAPRILLGRVAHPETRVALLTQDQFVHVIGPDHPLAAKRRVGAADLAAYPHVVNTFFNDIDDASMMSGLGMTETQLGLPGTGRHDVAQVQEFAAIPLIAMLSGSVAIVPRSLAEQLAPYFGCRIVGPVGTPIDICLAWSPRYDTDEGHRWFRELVIRTISA